MAYPFYFLAVEQGEWTLSSSPCYHEGVAQCYYYSPQGVTPHMTQVLYDRPIPSNLSPDEQYRRDRVVLVGCENGETTTFYMYQVVTGTGDITYTEIKVTHAGVRGNKSDYYDIKDARHAIAD